MEFFVVVIVVIGVFLLFSSRRGSSPAAPPAPRPQPRSAPPSPPGAAPSRAVPAAAARDGDRVWVPLGHTVTLGGYKVPGGVYTGRSLPALSGWRGESEPALIDPSLPVDAHRPDHTGASLDYWPSYSQISPQARAAYLAWLAAGRPPGAALGYVFLWFYGVERRVLVDAPHSQAAAAEVPQLLSEVERLLQSYGENGSFRGYAGDFLGAARLIAGTSDAATASPPTERVGWDFPIDLKVALGEFAARGEPLPAEWALAWVVCHPEARLRTAATRCPEEFARLFAARYQAQFGEGLKVKPNKTRLTVTYRPASASFGGQVTLDAGDIPDVTRLSAPLHKLRAIAEAAIADLDAYSRHLGRGGEPSSLAAQALLPAELLGADGPAKTLLSQMEARLGGADAATIDASDLVAAWPVATPGKMTKREAGALVGLLAVGGVGVEPDVRFGGSNLSAVRKAVLFRLGEATAAAPTNRYTAATALLHVAAAVAAADGTVGEHEEAHLEAHLEGSLHLMAAERMRLRAHLRWLLAEKPSLAGVKKRMDQLAPAQRHQVGQLLIGIAGADGAIDRDELKILAKLYPMLGLDPATLYADVHALSASAPSGPVTVVPREPGRDYEIPPAPAQADQAAIALAPDKVAAIMSETADVAQALGAVFDTDEAETDPEADGTADGETLSADTIAGLDSAHTTLVTHLTARPIWRRAEFDDLATALGLMPSGAIEAVNDAAFTVCDEPLLEGEDPLEVNPFAVKELTG